MYLWSNKKCFRTQISLRSLKNHSQQIRNFKQTLTHSKTLHSTKFLSSRVGFLHSTRFLAVWQAFSRVSRWLRRLQTTLGGIVFKDSRSEAKHSVGGEPLNQTDDIETS